MQREMTTQDVSKLAPKEHLEKLLEQANKEQSEVLHGHIRKVAKEWELESLLEQPSNVALLA